MELCSVFMVVEGRGDGVENFRQSIENPKILDFHLRRFNNNEIDKKI